MTALLQFYEAFMTAGSGWQQRGIASATAGGYLAAALGARSSAGEHYLDTVGVTGSIPVAPTSIGSKVRKQFFFKKKNQKFLPFRRYFHVN